MVDLTKFLISNLVDKPEAVVVEETTDDNGSSVLTVTVDPSDMGKVIGKGGKIINAVRELVKVKAIKSGKRVRLVLKDLNQIDQFSPSLPPAEPEETA